MHLEGLFLGMEPAARFTRGVLQLALSGCSEATPGHLKAFRAEPFYLLTRERETTGAFA